MNDVAKSPAASTTALRVQGGMMDVYWGVPARAAPGPGVLLMYHRGGIDKFTRHAVERLAGAGYRVAVPDVYHRCPPETLAPERKSFLKDAHVVADAQAALVALRARLDVVADRIVILGHCMGGRMALLVAGTLPEFCGAVVYYGGSVAKSWGNDGPTPFERLRNISCPVIGFFGDKDTHPSPQDVNAIDAELTKHGVAHDFHRYPEVGHGFQNPARDTLAERAAAEDAWHKTFAFLREVAPV